MLEWETVTETQVVYTHHRGAPVTFLATVQKACDLSAESIDRPGYLWVRTSFCRVPSAL